MKLGRGIKKKWFIYLGGFLCVIGATAGYFDQTALILYINNGYQFSLWYVLFGIGLSLLIKEAVTPAVSDPRVREFFRWFWGFCIAGLFFVLISNLVIKRLISQDWGILPLYASFKPSPLSYKLLIPLITGGIGLGLLHYLMRPQLSRVWYLVLLMMLSYILILGVAGMDGPLADVMVKNFSRYRMDYYRAVPMVNAEFIFRYAHNMIYLPLHAATHPPLPVLFLWCLTWLGLSELQCTYVVAAFGSLTIIPLFLLARRLYGDEAAKMAAAVYIFVPGILLYSATSLDVVFMFFCTLCLFYFVKCMWDSFLGNYFCWAVLFSLCLGFTFSSGLYLVFFGWFILLQERYFDKIKNLWSKLAVMGGALLGLHLLMWLFLDYNIVQVFVTAYRLNRSFLATHHSYFYWIWGNLAEYGIFLGVPLLVLISQYVVYQLNGLKKKPFPGNGYFSGSWDLAY
jgi:hypothetical protein